LGTKSKKTHQFERKEGGLPLFEDPKGKDLHGQTEKNKVNFYGHRRWGSAGWGKPERRTLRGEIKLEN